MTYTGIAGIGYIGYKSCRTIVVCPVSVKRNTCADLITQYTGCSDREVTIDRNVTVVVLWGITGNNQIVERCCLAFER